MEDWTKIHLQVSLTFRHYRKCYSVQCRYDQILIVRVTILFKLVFWTEKILLNKPFMFKTKSKDKTIQCPCMSELKISLFPPIFILFFVCVLIFMKCANNSGGHGVMAGLTLTRVVNVLTSDRSSNLLHASFFHKHILACLSYPLTQTLWVALSKPLLICH